MKTNTLLSTAVNARLLGLLAFVMLLPVIFQGDRFVAFVIGLTMINILWTAGMNLLYGYTGLVPLVYAGIAGFSAYGTARLVIDAHWPFWLAMPVSAVGAALVGVLLGLPSLRLRGFYLALSSLVTLTVVTLGFVYFSGFTNGDTGISQIPPPEIPFVVGLKFQGMAFDLLLSALAWIGVAGISVIVASPLGRRLIAIREDDTLADAVGIDVTGCKLTAFFIGSFYAGVGGALYATYVGFISPRSFDLLASLNIWLMVAFGGRGTIVGPIVGAAILTPVPFFLQQYDTLKDVIYGILIIAVIVLMPAGLYGEAVRRVRSSPTAKRLRAVLGVAR